MTGLSHDSSGKFNKWYMILYLIAYIFFFVKLCKLSDYYFLSTAKSI